jgi:alcohol dehydrogenase
MQAVIYETFGGPLTVETVSDPGPSTDGVVIGVKANGICRSDWHGWQGHDPDITLLPHVPGHELAGQIVAVGKDVQRWSVGDRVTVPFVLGCGRCPDCAKGDHQVCAHQYQPGFTGWGSFAEYVALPYADTNLVQIPDALDYANVASLGCRFATSFRAVVTQGRVNPGEWVTVHGCGGVGLSAVMIAAAMGAQVIAVDIKTEALDLATSLGAMYTINAHNVSEVVEAIHDVTRGGAHVSLDALGSVVTARNSILGLRRRGRHVQVGLLVGDDADPPLPMGRVIGWELEIYGSHGLQAHAYPEMLRLIEHGVLDPSRLVTKRVALGDVPSVLKGMTTFGATGVYVMDHF